MKMNEAPAHQEEIICYCVKLLLCPAVLDLHLTAMCALRNNVLMNHVYKSCGTRERHVRAIISSTHNLSLSRELFRFAFVLLGVFV